MAATSAVPLGVPDEVRRLRLDAGFRSQSEFAKAMKVSRTTVSAWETGDREPSISQYRRMLELAGQAIHQIRHVEGTAVGRP